MATPTGQMTVTLTRELEQFVRDQVQGGAFATTSEAVRDAVRVWQRQRLEDAERLDAIRARIRRSLDDPRPSLSLEEVDANLEEMFAQAEKDARRA